MPQTYKNRSELLQKLGSFFNKRCGDNNEVRTLEFSEYYSIIITIEKKSRSVDKCNQCKVKECESRELIKKMKDPILKSIIEKNCNEYKKEEL